MFRKQVNAQSPLRILDDSIHGGLGTGNLGLVMSRAGVGKTACLVQIALDDLMRERPVLHIALEQTVDHVVSWYDTLFADLAANNDLEGADAVYSLVQKNRMIAAFSDHMIGTERFDKAVTMFSEHVGVEPAAILIDGYRWSAHATEQNRDLIAALKKRVEHLGAELWMSAQTHRLFTGGHPIALPQPYNAYQDCIDVAIFLEPQGADVVLRLLKDHDREALPPTRLHLHPDTMRLVTDGEFQEERGEVPASLHTLLSGGAPGAESYFGLCAERWGLMELNFSFASRSVERPRGLVILNDAELEQGGVSTRYLETHMHRRYPDTPEFRRILQSIWHQVNTAEEVFCIGQILPDKTVKGGTGWAVELAVHFDKRVHVFDQERKQWSRWDGEDWGHVQPPSILHRRFAGTGTRYLSDNGRAAIEALYQRSFGAPTPTD